MTDQIKLVIMGMDNAGKTTLLKVLTKEDSENLDIRPTQGIKKGTYKNLKVWDFGGQELYRNKYLTSSKKYFDSISYFFFVVDIQDKLKLYPSAMYFKGVFQLIERNSPEAKLVFLFHKNDPKFDSKKLGIKEKFMEVVSPTFASSKIKYKSFDTSIYNKESIKKAFKDVK